LKWNELKERLNQICTVQRKLIQDELLVWKREQQLARNGWKQFTKNLNDIQNSCERLLDSHIALHNDLELFNQRLMSQQSQTKDPGEDALLPHNYHSLTSRAVALLGEFLNASLVVECQPSQVYKLKTRYVYSII